MKRNQYSEPSRHHLPVLPGNSLPVLSPTNRFINLGFFIALITFATSCQFATFTAKPGVSVKEYPTDMYGTYRCITREKGVRDTHTLVINEKGARVDDSRVDLSDTNYTLSHLGDFYYVNERNADSAGNSWYFVYPFKYDKSHIYLYHLVITDKNIKRMTKCGLVRTGTRKNEYRMDNEPFRKYCEKYLKKRDAMVFKRIN